LGTVCLLLCLVSTQATLQILPSWQRCWAKLGYHLHHLLVLAKYHRFLECCRLAYYRPLDFLVGSRLRRRGWGWVLLLLSRFLEWQVEGVRARTRRSRRLRVVEVFGGEDRYRVRKRVCRWSRGRGSTPERGDAVKGVKCITVDTWHLAAASFHKLGLMNGKQRVGDVNI
jgi:hypothetical protein